MSTRLAALAGLSTRMGNLALAMGPLGRGRALIVGAFGKCVATAASFEDQMARSAPSPRATHSEMQALEAAARELGATTPVHGFGSWPGRAISGDGGFFGRGQYRGPARRFI